MNRLAIELNNAAVKELESGSLYKALESVSLACHLTSQQSHVHTNVDPTQFRFHWRDCSQGAFKAPLDNVDSSDSFLYLNFLTITPPDDTSINISCPCGFAWAIWYNMALLYTVAGAVTGEKGHILLHCAGTYLDQVKVRTEAAEEEPSRDWARLQIAVLNNQAYISKELCMHGQAQEQLKEMEIRLRCAAKVLDQNVWQEFTLNLQCLNKTSCFASAA